MNKGRKDTKDINDERSHASGDGGRFCSDGEAEAGGLERAFKPDVDADLGLVLVEVIGAGAHEVARVGVDARDDLEVEAEAEDAGDVGQVDGGAHGLEGDDGLLVDGDDLLPAMEELGGADVERLDELGADDGQGHLDVDGLQLEGELHVEGGALVEVGGGGELDHLRQLLAGLHAGLDGLHLHLEEAAGGQRGQEVVKVRLRAVAKVDHHAPGRLGVL